MLGNSWKEGQMSRKLLLALAITLCGTAFAQTAPTLDEVINKNTAAKGGLEKIKAIQTEKVTGKAVLGGAMEAPLTLYQKRPNMSRTEISFQGRQIVQAFDGTDSWMINPMMGSSDAQKMPEEQAKRARDLATMDGLLLDYKAKGMTGELMGKEDVDGSPAYKIKLTSKTGDIIYYYIDAENYLDVKQTARVSQNGQDAEVESLFSAYKPEGGVMTPHTVEQRVNGQPVVKMVFEKVEINSPIDDAIFKFPVKSDAKPEEKK